ncbi:MAG: BlaI/MecI/CopY family transcriptional regulator [Phycisphaerales bacterium]|nr:BlaI/MecI/CopY family transcriptional regulator [Phycisphaerales bacterium]
MARRRIDLGDAELDVLNVLWECGQSTVREVLEGLHARGRKVAYTTAQTVLARLEQKGYVSSNKSGFSFVYKAKVTRDRVLDSRVRGLMHDLCDGQAAPLVLHLMEKQRFSADDLAKFQELIDRLDEEGAS